MSIIKSRIKAAIGPTHSRRLSNLLYGNRLDEVSIIHSTFHKLGVVGTMIDVGAHRGGSLHQFASAGWSIHAFEPDANNRKHLLTLVGHNRNVKIDKRGVSNETRFSVPFFVSDKIGGISSLSRFHQTHNVKQTIDTVTLKDYILQNAIRNIDFLKVDVEGHDLFVLQGLDWEASAPDCIVCEYEDRKTLPNGYSTHDLCAFLKDKGYDFMLSEWFPIKEYGGQHRWKSFHQTAADVSTEGWGNIIAWRPKTKIGHSIDWTGLSKQHS